jgi:alcohol dehydrogenase
MVFQPMPRIVQGWGALEKNLQPEVSRFSVKKVLIVTDPGLVSSGIPDRVRNALGEKYSVDIYGDSEADPSVESVDKCAAYVRENKFDLLIGLGGGSPIDTAKCASILATNPGNTIDYLGIENVPKPGLPKILIPTTAGTGSEVTNVAVLSLKADRTKKGIVSRHIMAQTAILDAELTVGLPSKVTAATGMDALTHAIEAYVSRYAQPMTDYFALEAIRRISRSLCCAVHFGQNVAAREDMLVGSLYAGLAFGSAATGMVHGLAMPLGGLYNIPHGIANAVLLPHVMRFNLVAATQRFANIAEAFGQPVKGLSIRDAAERAVGAVECLSRDIGIPRYLDDLGIPRSGIAEIARDGMTNSRQVLPNPRDVTLEGLVSILRGAFREDLPVNG